MPWTAEHEAILRKDALAGRHVAEIARKMGRGLSYSATIWVGSARQSGWRVGVAAWWWLPRWLSRARVLLNS